jgi:hypothetical protein
MSSRCQYVVPSVMASPAIPLAYAAAAACIYTAAVAQPMTIDDDLLCESPSAIAVAANPDPTFIVDQQIRNWIKFQGLVDLWKHERGSTSSITEMSALRPYQTIIGMGEDAVPLILAQLEAEGDDPDQWFWALIAITEANPGKEYQGNYRKMAQSWFQWAKDEGYAW